MQLAALPVPNRIHLLTLLAARLKTSECARIEEEKIVFSVLNVIEKRVVWRKINNVWIFRSRIRKKAC